MGRFRFWLENDDSQKMKELQSIWSDTFKALGVGGLSDEDAAQQSLSKITFGSRRGGDESSVFKGKRAVGKRLENGQIFSRLERLNDPELRKAIEDTRRWLDSTDGDKTANASTTISNLLQRMFGQYFQQFIDQDFPKVDQAKAQVQPQPPKPDGMGGEPSGGDNSMQQAPQAPDQGMGPMPPQGQPQAPQGMGQPAPTNPMPPKPAGAEMGLF